MAGQALPLKRYCTPIGKTVIASGRWALARSSAVQKASWAAPGSRAESRSLWPLVAPSGATANG